MVAVKPYRSWSRWTSCRSGPSAGPGRPGPNPLGAGDASPVAGCAVAPRVGADASATGCSDGAAPGPAGRPDQPTQTSARSTTTTPIAARCAEPPPPMRVVVGCPGGPSSLIRSSTEGEDPVVFVRRPPRLGQQVDVDHELDHRSPDGGLDRDGEAAADEERRIGSLRLAFDAKLEDPDAGPPVDRELIQKQVKPTELYVAVGHTGRRKLVQFEHDRHAGPAVRQFQQRLEVALL